MSVLLRKYNTLLVTGTTAVRIPIIKRGVTDFAASADWTPTAGDVKVWVDGTAANITNLPTAINSGNCTEWEFILTAAELSCKSLHVVVTDSATKAVEDTAFTVETFGNASAMYPYDLTDGVRLGLTALPAASYGSAGGVGDIQRINGVSASSVTTIKPVIGLTTADTIATYTGNTPQTGDSFARLTGTGAVTFASLTVSGNTIFTGTTAHTGNVSYADGLTIAAPSTANRSGITVTGNGTGDGMTLNGGSSNGRGLNAIGNGTSSGLRAVGGDTGNGATFTGGATSGAGLQATATAGNSSGLSATGQGSGHGVLMTAGATGAGLRVTGATGVNISGTAGAGLASAGNGANAGMRLTGGATGNALDLIGGSTSGDGISATIVSGSGFHLPSITVDGATTLTGAVSATNASNDIRGVKLAATGLAGITSWTVDITGSLSGSVGSVTGAINTGAGTITTLDALDTAQDTQHGTTQAAIAAIWTTALTEAYRATGATGTGAQLLYELLANLINFANAGTLKTVTKLDKTTTAKTYTYDDATTPTAIEETT